MKVQLVVLKAGQRKRVFKLPSEEAIIGRGKGSAVRIPSSGVSRKHCRISELAGQITIEDLESTNGTLLNGEAIRGVQLLQPGDRIRVGPVIFLVEVDESADFEPVEVISESEAAEVEDFDVELDQEAQPEMEEVQQEVEGPYAEEIEETEENDKVELDDAGPWQLPEAGSLRDILMELDGGEDERPKSKDRKGKK
jgi:pSer/pThr/pTyr-binding forkhead associated (FHA) protein